MYFFLVMQIVFIFLPKIKAYDYFVKISKKFEGGLRG